MKKLELLKNVMYNMFLEGTLQDLDLDMDDYICMWEALIDKWEIKIEKEKLESFIDEINCTLSNKYTWFTTTFNKYFYGEDYNNI